MPFLSFGPQACRKARKKIKLKRSDEKTVTRMTVANFVKKTMTPP